MADLETPDADALEQEQDPNAAEAAVHKEQEAEPSDAREANEADVAEQAQEVELDEDEYR